MDPKVNKTMGSMTLGLSNWTICSLQNPFCVSKFPLFQKSDAAFPFSCIQGKGHSKMDPNVSETMGSMTMGHSNWTICSLQNLFCVGKFPLFQKPDAAYPFSCMQGKGHSKIDPKVSETMGSMTWGIQIGPFAVYKTYFLWVNFRFFKSHMLHSPFPACSYSEPQSV